MSRDPGVWRHALGPAVGVCLGSAAGLLVNVVTNGPQIGAVVGLVVVVLVWALWEGWLSARRRESLMSDPANAEPAGEQASTDRPERGLRAHLTADVLDGGQVVGLRTPLPVDDANVQIALGTAANADITVVDITGVPLDGDIGGRSDPV